MRFSLYVLAFVAAAALAADGDSNKDDNNDKTAATTGQKLSPSTVTKTQSKEGEKTTATEATSSKTTNKSESKKETKSGDKNKSESTDKSDKSDSKENKSDSKKSSKSEKPTTTSKFSTSIDPRLPAGGVDLLTPEATTTTYIKLGDYATFVWNYTSLSVTPSALNIEAYCSLNRHYYTIAANQSAKETSVVWDTSKYVDNGTDDTPLVNSNYQLYIYDAEQDMNAVASAGYLASFNRYQFGIYSPQPYVPMDEFQCNGCQGKAKSAASGGADMLLVAKMLMAMCFIVVASFMHFTI